MKILLVLSVFALCAKHVLGQNNIQLEGWIYNAETGAHVSDVNIQIVERGFMTTSDEVGYFYLENVPEGNYEIRFEHIAFEKQQSKNIHVNKDMTHQLSIFLVPKPIEGQTILVYAPREKYTTGMSGLTTTIEKEQIVRYEQLGIEKLLNQIAGLQVESSLTGGGETTVRIHGSQASQVLVLLDGQRLNNPQTGTVDLSIIPLDQLERVEVIPHGNSALFGGNAFAGVLQFFSRHNNSEKTLSLKVRYGSFNSANGRISTNLDMGSFTVLANYLQDYSRQNFSYDYQGHNYQRENAWYRNRKALAKLGVKKGFYSGSLLVNTRMGKRGLPSANFNEQAHFDSRLDESYSTFHSNQRFFWNPKQFTQIIAGINEIQQTFNNEKDISPFRIYKIKNINRTLEGRAEHHYSSPSSYNLIFGYQHLTEYLNQKNLLHQSGGLGQKERKIQAVYSGFDWQLPMLKTLFQSLKVNAALRYENYFKKQEDWYPLAGIFLQPRGLTTVSLSSIYSRSIRYPDFNSLFWKGDARSQGNPELLPEQNKSWNVQLGYRPGSGILPQVQLRYYRESISDLIFWHRGVNGIWEPRNLLYARKNGMDAELSKSFLGQALGLQTAYNYNNATNLSNEPTTDGKKIIFIPQHTFNSTLDFRYKHWFLQLLYRYVSERETVAFNSKGSQLAAYQVLDLSLQRSIEIRKYRIHSDLTIKNVLSEDYQLLFGYPMPGIEVLFSLELKWDFSK